MSSGQVGWLEFNLLKAIVKGVKAKILQYLDRRTGKEGISHAFQVKSRSRLLFGDSPIF